MPLSNPALGAVRHGYPLPFRAVPGPVAVSPRVCANFATWLRINGDWTDDGADRITTACRRFLYLKPLSGQPVTPSPRIDPA